MLREEAIMVLKNEQPHCGKKALFPEEKKYEAYDVAIKALEQELILDKIRAEIEALPKTYPFVNHFDTYVKEDDVKKIIDKYRTESEIHCNCTDEEIAKSFTEDVEAVKDLLSREESRE